MPGKWFMNDFTEWACHEAYHIEIQTDTPSHLWLRYTFRSPWKHPRTRVFRGLAVVGDVYYCFASFQDVEQDEIGDTLSHNFSVPNLLSGWIFYFFFWGNVAGVQSPSMSPLFARSLYYVYSYLAATITHENDAATARPVSVTSNPPAAPVSCSVGNIGGAGFKMGGAFRFRDLALPRCAEILASYLALTSFGTSIYQPVHSRISAELSGNAQDFYDISLATFMARWNNRTGVVDYDNMPPWFSDVVYDSPSLIAPVQNVVLHPSWRSGNALVLFWDDFDQRTPQFAFARRLSRAYTAARSDHPVLHTWYNHWLVKEEIVF